MYTIPLWLLCTICTVFCTLIAVGCTLLAARVNCRLPGEDGQAASALHAFVGVVYAVALALIVVSVQESFSDVEQAAMNEASAAGDLYRNVAGMNAEVRDRIQAATIEYLKLVIDEEWPILQRGGMSERTSAAADALVDDVVQIVPGNTHEEALLYSLLEDADNIMDGRRTRLFKGMDGIGATTWTVIVIGGLLTLQFAGFFHWHRGDIQLVAMGIAGAMLGLMIFLIIAMDYPLFGHLSVQPDAFRVALGSLEHQRKSVPVR